MLDLEDVGMERAMRQRLVSTFWLGREQEATLSGNFKVVFLVTYSSSVLVEFLMNFSGVKDRHCCWKSEDVGAGSAAQDATVAKRCKRRVASAHMVFVRRSTWDE
jgi:hypothetical protein